jgi:hypothetical protein
MCKPHKANGCCPAHKKMRFGDRQRFEAGRDQMRCEGLDRTAAN